MNFFRPTLARKLEPEKIITWKKLTGALFTKNSLKTKTIWLIYCSWWDWKKAVSGMFRAIMKHSFYGHRPFRAAFSFKMVANSQDNKDIICKNQCIKLTSWISMQFKNKIIWIYCSWWDWERLSWAKLSLERSWSRAFTGISSPAKTDSQSNQPFIVCTPSVSNQFSIIPSRKMSQKPLQWNSKWSNAKHSANTVLQWCSNLNISEQILIKPIQRLLTDHYTQGPLGLLRGPFTFTDSLQH